MAKVKPHEISKEMRKKAINDLFEAIEKLKTKKEIVKFFLGLFTASEALMLARRIQVAQLLLEDKSYEDIRKILNVSSHLVHRVDQWLYKGEDDDIQWLQEIIKKEKKRQKPARHYSEGLLNRYVFHRMWSDLFD